MSATLAPPPVDQPPARRGGAPARRAIRRWAWRLLRREWRQQLLVLCLLTAAVAATVVGLGLVVNVQPEDQGLFGSASARLEIVGAGSAGQARDLVAARQRFGTVDAISHANVPVPGATTAVDLRDQAPNGAYTKPTLRLVSGRYPAGPGEAAVTAAVATAFNLKIGSTWAADGRAQRVIGTVENPLDLEDAFGLVAPGQIGSPSRLTLLVDANDEQAISFRPPAGTVQDVMSSGSDAAQRQRNQALAVLLLATIGLTFIGLLSVAGFTVMAQRRLRAMGMIGAIGGTDRQVRAVMLANGAAVGVVGAAAGCVIGLAVWLALTPAFEQVVGHRYNPFRLPWWAVVAGVVLAVVTSLAASWWPARTAAKLPVVAALSGRPAPPQPAHRFALLGTVLAVAGFVSLTFAHSGHTNHAVRIVGGILALTAGMLLLAPLGIRALALVARHAPIAVRLALRDLARYQARSGAALAAASLAIGIAATITVTASAEQAHDHTLTGGNLPTNQLIVWLNNPNQQGGPATDVARLSAAKQAVSAPNVPNPAVVARARSTAHVIAQALGSKTVVELDIPEDLTTLLPAGAPSDANQVALVRPVTGPGGRHGWNQLTVPFVATPPVLGLYHVPAGALASGAGILSSRGDLTGVALGAGLRDDFTPITVTPSALLPNYTSAPNTLITPGAVTAHGYSAEPVGWLVQSAHTISPAQVTSARNTAAAHGVTVENRTGPDHGLSRLRDYSTAAGALVALGVLAMTVGLIRSETAGDLRVLAAAGASGGTRRTLNAASAGALAVLGGILGTATAYLALIAWYWDDVAYLNRPPYLNLAVLIAGLPLIATAGAWLLGRTPKSLGRRPID